MFSHNFRRNVLALLSLLMLGYSQVGMAGWKKDIPPDGIDGCKYTLNYHNLVDHLDGAQSYSKLPVYSVTYQDISQKCDDIQSLFPNCDAHLVDGDIGCIFFKEKVTTYPSGGYVSIGSSLTEFADEKVSQISIVPDSGYSFLGWYGSCSGNSFNTTVNASTFRNCKFTQLPIPPATITGVVFNDSNGNGIRDANEPGLDKWAVTSNVLVNNKNQDSQGKTYDRTVITNNKGEYTLGACNPKKDASGKYDSAEVAKCLTLPGWFAVAVEQRVGWTSTTPNPFEKFDLNVSVSAQNTVNYDSYAGLEFGVFNGYILKTAVPTNGTITSSDSKINCSVTSSKTCQAGFPVNSSVTLTAKPATGYFFNQWSGNCSGTNPSVTLKMDVSKSCSATFVQAVLLNVNVNSGGKMNAGLVKSQPTGISCGVGDMVAPDCKEGYILNQSVVLTASPTTGYTFTGWSGACSGTSPNITIKMDTAKSCTANFAPVFNLTVSKTGNGTITGTGINCGTDCSEAIAANTKVTLTAAPSSDSYFSNWSGACAGSALTCTVTMSAAQTVSAVFKPFVKKELSSPTLDFSVSNGLSTKCSGVQETEVCLPTNCDFSSNRENQSAINNPGGGSGVNLSTYRNGKGETCSKLKVEVCAKKRWGGNAWYKGSTTISGLCK